MVGSDSDPRLQVLPHVDGATRDTVHSSLVISTVLRRRLRRRSRFGFPSRYYEPSAIFHVQTAFAPIVCSYRLGVRHLLVGSPSVWLQSPIVRCIPSPSLLHSAADQRSFSKEDSLSTFSGMV